VGVRQPRLDWYVRAARGPGKDRDAVAAAASRLGEALLDGPLKRAEIVALIGSDLFNGATLSLDLVRVPPSGTWERRRADLYGLASEWVGPPAVSLDDALDLLVRRYLGGFGPATRAEIALWAGVPAAYLAPAIERLKLRRYRGETGAELLDLPDLAVPDGDTPAPVRYLPVWDATLLVHARRTGILPEEHRSKVFHIRRPHSVNTFLVDGAVAGTWTYEAGRIVREEFAPLPKRVRRELDAEAEGLAALHG
jgi:hypothetical protein